MSRADHIAFIGDGQSDVHLLVADAGVKAVNLARLDRLGVRVPPAIVLGTALSQEYLSRGSLPAGFTVHLASALRRVENATGLKLGGPSPLLVSVRSSPVVAMPGAVDTVLNLGLTEQIVGQLVARTGNPWFAWDCYRRLVRGFGEIVHQIAPHAFDQLTDTYLTGNGVRALQDLDPLSMRDLAHGYEGVLRSEIGSPLPRDPVEQVVRAIEALLASWNSPRARECRRVYGLYDRAGTGIVVQAMVFGNDGAGSGSGIGFTRNPSTGDDELYVDFALNAQGEDVFKGPHVPLDAASLPDLLPNTWAELQRVRPTLEREFGDLQEFEFTVESGRLFFLQTRAAKRTAWAAARIAVDLVRSGIIDADTALKRLAMYDLNAIVRQTVRPSRTFEAIARGVPASAGVATGAVAFDVERAKALARERPVILVRTAVVGSDLAGLNAAAGILMATGSRAAPVALLARQHSIPCVVRCASLHVSPQTCTCSLGAQTWREGDVLTIDGSTGLVYAGRADIVSDRPDEALAVIASWRQQFPPERTPKRKAG